MTLYGGIQFQDTGISANIRAMHLQTEILGIIQENVNGFDKVGYQRKDPVVSSFSSLIGVHGLSVSKDDAVGRLDYSNNPLDISLAKPGYFQTLGKDGAVELTRDGRFKLDKDGNLLTLNDGKVLSNTGLSIKVPFIIEKLEDIKVNKNGEVRAFNKETNKLEYVATLGVVTDKGIAVVDPAVVQGYNEASNVNMSSEALGLVCVKRNFEANRKMFILQNSNLLKAISQLGS